MAGLSGDWIGDHKPIRIHEQTDGSNVALFASHFPDRLLMTKELLLSADPNLLDQRFRTVTLRLANGLAVYRIVACWPRERTYGLKRVYSEEAV